MATRVNTGCATCKRCMNSYVGEGARKTGRGTAFLLTGGVSELVMLETRNCGACGHKLSLHEETVEGWKQRATRQERERKQEARSAALHAASGDASKIDEVNEINDSLTLDSTPGAAWDVATGGFAHWPVKKRNEAKMQLRLEVPRTDGHPVVVVTLKVVADGEHATIVYHVRPSFWGGASVVDDPMKILHLNDHLKQIQAQILTQFGQPTHQAQGRPAVTTTDVESGPTLPPDRSVVDELMKLSHLRDVGALTEEEFQQLKSRLLFP